MSGSSTDYHEKEENTNLPPLSKMLIFDDVTVGQIAISDERAGLRHWMVATGTRCLFLATFAFLHAIIFSFSFWSSYINGHLTVGGSTVGITLPMANAAALILYFDLAILIFPVCQTLTSFLKRTPLGVSIHPETNILFHKAVGWYLVFFASVHTICHWINFALLVVEDDTGFQGFLVLNFGTIPGWSGYVMLIILGLIAVTSLPKRRLADFERFYYTHHLFVVFFVISSIHGMCCMVKQENGPVSASTCNVEYDYIWKWWLYGGFGYLLAERILKEFVGRYKTSISKVIQHPCDVVEIQVKKEKTRMRIGQACIQGFLLVFTLT